MFSRSLFIIDQGRMCKKIVGDGGYVHFKGIDILAYPFVMPNHAASFTSVDTKGDSEAAFIMNTGQEGRREGYGLLFVPSVPLSCFSSG